MLGRGFGYSSVKLGLGVPAAVLLLWHLDVAAFAPGLPPGVSETIGGLAVVFQIIGMVITLLHGSLQVPAAVFAGGERHPFPCLFGRPERFAGWGLGAGSGALLGVASVAVFHLLRIDVGADLKNLLKMMPGVDWHAPAIVLGVSLPAILGAALGEEVMYRGVLQALLSQRLAGRAGSFLAIVLTSLIWALAHSLNTDAPWVKLGQIFVIGLAFGAIARRYSVEASALAHLALNLMALLGGWAFGLS